MRARVIESAIRTLPSLFRVTMMETPFQVSGAKNPRLPPPQAPRRGLWHLPVTGRLPAFLILASSVLKKLNSGWMQLRRWGLSSSGCPSGHGAEVLTHAWHAESDTGSDVGFLG